jgi:hypothetical protein
MFENKPCHSSQARNGIFRACSDGALLRGAQIANLQLLFRRRGIPSSIFLF